MSTSQLKDPRFSVQNLNLKKGDSSEKLNKLKIVRLSNSRSNCKSNLSSQKETSREGLKIQNLIKLQNLKDKLVFKPGVKVRLRNTSLQSNGSKTQNSASGAPTENQEIKRESNCPRPTQFVHQIDNQPEGGTRKQIKHKVSLLLNQNLKHTLKSTKRLATMLDKTSKENFSQPPQP